MKFLLALIIVIVGSTTMAQGLVIHGSEVGVGKFHRMDNHVHPYLDVSVWRPYIMPDNGGLQTPMVYKNGDGSFTIQFSSLEELLQTSIKLATQANTKIQVLNIHGHGLPGGMWYPKDAAQLKSMECAQWRQSAAAPDKDNYDQYYSPVSKSQIMAIRQASEKPGHYACITGLNEWKEIVARIPNIQSHFSDSAQIHFLSCVVGLGPVGQAFTEGVGALLLPPTGNTMVKSSIKFGIGDWSMTEGMGFWDYINDQQLAHDNEIYPKDRKDREIMQTGPIRMAHFMNGAWMSHVMADQKFMLLNGAGMQLSDSNGRLFVSSPIRYSPVPLPRALKIPGTGTVVPLMKE